ncbi:MAG: hypothetical protein VW338_00975 [Rhodospirillaceae bacterium]
MDQALETLEDLAGQFSIARSELRGQRDEVARETAADRGPAAAERAAAIAWLKGLADTHRKPHAVIGPAYDEIGAALAAAAYGLERLEHLSLVPQQRKTAVGGLAGEAEEKP